MIALTALCLVWAGELGLPAVGSGPAGLVRALVAEDGSVNLQTDARRWSIPAPAPSCTGSVVVEPAGIRVRWICGASIDRFGRVHEVRLAADGAELGRVDRDGVDWLIDELERRLTAGDRDGARGLLAEFAGRLQYAATPEQRAAVLSPWLREVVRASGIRRAAGDAAGAADLVVDLLQSPPVWEPERPWDYMDRVRLGPPAGNRPAPERAAYLAPTPEIVAWTLELAVCLELGGHPDASAELARNLARVDPSSAEVRLQLGDALWATRDRVGAAEAYAEFVRLRAGRPLPARVTARQAEINGGG